MSIKENNGKYRSERSPEEIHKILQDDIQNLTKDEREVLSILLKELSDPSVRGLEDSRAGGGPPRLLDVLADAEYVRPIVDMRTFVMSPYYLGATASSLYPKLLDDLVELFDGGYREAIFSGSIGSGKSYAGSIIICRILYEMSCLRNIHRSFGIAPDTNISIIALSVSESLAIKVIFENIATKLAQSPYFQEYFKFEQTKTELRFPHNIWVGARATTDANVLGLNVISFVMDESNFLEGIQRGKASIAKYGVQDKAQHLYDGLVRRMKSRFNNKGRLPGMGVLLSSKRTKDDFTQRRINESANDPTVFCRDYTSYDLRPDAFSSKTFSVLVGNESMPSRLLAQEEVGLVKQSIKDKQDNSLLIIEVPEDFRVDFEADIDSSIRDIGGIATVSISPFIQQRDKIESCVDQLDQPQRKHPFQVQSWDQSKTGSFIWERIAERTIVRDGATMFEGWQPRYFPQFTRHVHIDPSLTGDATGFCQGCIIGYRNMERRNVDSMETYFETAPVIWIDMMLEIVPPTGGEIDFSGIRGLVYQMQDHGFTIGMATADQWNSASMLQTFRTKGIDSERLSVDKPMDAYETLKSALYDGRIYMYRYEPVLQQLRTLQVDRIKRKVDHQKNGKKDIADALAGVVYSLTTKAHHAPLMIMKGITQNPDPVQDDEQKMVNNEEDWNMIPFFGGGFK